MSEKDKQKGATSKNIPKDGQVIMAMMKEMGINEYEPKTVFQLTEFVYRYATSILDEARMYANSKKKNLDVDDVRLALQLTNESSFTTPPPREVIIECAKAKNYTPLQNVKPYCGLRLPPDRYCLSSCNYSLKAAHKKPKTYAVLSGIKLNTKANVSYIKRTNPAGVTKQTVSIAKPKINVASEQKPAFKPKIHVTQNVQIASPSVQSTSVGAGMVIVDNILKRKREEDDLM